MQELLIAWSREEVQTRRDRTLARRLSASRPTPHAEPGQPAGDIDTERAQASLPGVIDLLDRLASRSTTGLAVPDDLDVFEQYYARRPDEEVFEVFDE
ncbi:hypothetical protein [Rhodococcus ruber]|uniref:hypothetical protein n=1 Tax=Rhodococcus ruber TaxID=1830 RepID=UPI0026D5F622